MTRNTLGMEELAHTIDAATKAVLAFAGEVDSPLPSHAAPTDFTEVAQIAPCGSRALGRRN